MRPNGLTIDTDKPQNGRPRPLDVRCKEGCTRGAIHLALTIGDTEADNDHYPSLSLHYRWSTDEIRPSPEVMRPQPLRSQRMPLSA